jgi:hypothetical protein
MKTAKKDLKWMTSFEKSEVKKKQSDEKELMTHVD